MQPSLARLRGRPQPVEVALDPGTLGVSLDGRPLGASTAWDVPVSGTVYGVALNFRAALAALGPAVNASPYKAPPRAPILYIKPRNTHSANGVDIEIPADVEEVAVGPTVGIVIGKPATRVSLAQALDVVAGYTVVNDLAVPHESYYRPAIRQQCRDGFCPIGPVVAPATQVGDPGRLSLRALVNGQCRLQASLGDLVRSVPELLRDVTEFMSLAPGDVLTVGLPAALPRARAGDTVTVEVCGVGRLSNRLVAAPGAAGARQ